MQRFDEESQHKAAHPGQKTEGFTVERKTNTQPEDKAEDKNHMIDEEEFHLITRLITKAKIPGRMTAAKQEMVPMMKAYADKAYNTVRSQLKKLVSEKYSEYEYLKMKSEDS